MLNHIKINNLLYEEVNPDNWITKDNLRSFRGWIGPESGNVGWYTYNYKICPDIIVGFKDNHNRLQVGLSIEGEIDLFSEVTPYEATVDNVSVIMGSGQVNKLIKPLANELAKFNDMTPAQVIAFLVSNRGYYREFEELINDTRVGFLPPKLRSQLTMADD